MRCWPSGVSRAKHLEFTHKAEYAHKRMAEQAFCRDYVESESDTDGNNGPSNAREKTVCFKATSVLHLEIVFINLAIYFV